MPSTVQQIRDLADEYTRGNACRVADGVRRRTGFGPELTCPEVGSRAMFRLLGDEDTDNNGWIHVQPGQYRYRVFWDQAVRVRLVIREYLAAEVTWTP
jgi:hypothetical protein